MDWEREGLLDGLEGADREGRRRLLDELHADGSDVEELRAAVAEDRLVLLPIERALLSAPRYTLAEVAEAAGTDSGAVELDLRAMGLHIPEDPAVRAYGDEDVEAARRVRRYVEAGVPVAENRGVTRVVSGAMARTAETMRQVFAATYLRPGDREDELARRYAEMAEALLPLVAADLEYMLRHHLRDFIRHDALGMAERRDGRLPDAAEVAVAFADIVGFTALGQEVPETALSDIAERLEALALEHLRRPARVVKAIGDAVMVVSADCESLVESMLELVDAAGREEGFPPLRAGIAYGTAVGRLGDWHGPTVNLASRVCGRARPDSVLVTNVVRDVLGASSDRYVFSEAGFKQLKGYAKPVPVLRVRRAGSGDRG